MGNILDTLSGPDDLRAMGREQLAELAAELRQEIARVVALNGGHLASNLGVVELTLALHRCFDFSTDALLWDVGHQCYAHKLLTGRREQFPTLRRRGGLSGFPNKEESPYDLFTTGHAGTSISEAMGLVCADELAGRRRRVVAVIGDGSLTSGVALEALNHAGSLGKDLLVVLNDNRMSISATVGGLSRHLDRLRSAQLYNQTKDQVRTLLSHLPAVGEWVESALGHLKEGLKASLLSGCLFEHLGFRTFGPVDGHDLDGLIATLEAVRELSGPLLVHVVTEKGRGHAQAASDPARYHSARPAASPGEGGDGKRQEPERPSYTSVFASALCRLGREREDLVAVTAAMEEGTGLVEFKKEFPRRFFDVGICEEHAVAFAGALAAAGCRPVVGIYSTFLQRGYDQVFHDLCLQGAGVVLCLDRAGLVGADGPTHHGLYDLAYLRHLPGIVLAAPRDGRELEALLEAAVCSDRPWAIRFPKAPVPDVPWAEGPPAEPGRGQVLREGSDVALVAYGAMVAAAWEAAEALAGEGVEAAVVDARFAKPIDARLVRSVAEGVPLVVTVEEHALACGFGSAVLEAVGGPAAARVVRMGIPDRFVEHGSREALLADLGLCAEGIAERVRRALGKSGERRSQGAQAP